MIVFNSYVANDIVNVQSIWWLESVIISSLAKSFSILAKNLFRSCNIIVSLQPLSALHIRQVLVIASGPESHWFTHLSHPNMVLQHLVMIRSGFAGTERQMWHLNVSLIICFRSIGNFDSGVNVIISVRVSLMDAISSVNCSILSANFVFLALFS